MTYGRGLGILSDPLVADSAVGGHLGITGGGPRGVVLIEGDRVALIRFGVAVLKCGITHQSSEELGRFNPAKLGAFFRPPSAVTDVVLILDARPERRTAAPVSKPLSIFKIIWSIMFKR